MKVAVIINLPNDIEKTNEIYQNFQEIAFKNNVELAVEVNGLENVDNALKDEDIVEVKLVVVVSNEELDTARFGEKNVVCLTYDEALNNFESILVAQLKEQSEKSEVEDKPTEESSEVKDKPVKESSDVENKTVEESANIEDKPAEESPNVEDKTAKESSEVFDEAKDFKITKKEVNKENSKPVEKKKKNQSKEKKDETTKKKAIKVNKVRLEQKIERKEEKVVTDTKKDMNEKCNWIKNLYKHLSVGAAAVLPFIIVAGLLTVFIYIFNSNVGQLSGSLGAISHLSTAIFSLFVPVLAAFIAMSIADKEGFLPGLVGGALIGISGGGFICGIIVGLFAGYVTKLFKNNLKLSESLNSFKRLLLVPLLSVLIVGLITIYIGEPVLKHINRIVEVWICELSELSGVLSGAVAGILISIDFGASVISKAIFSLARSQTSIPQTAAFAATIIAPLGLALATLFAKQKFNKDELLLGKVSWLFGLAGVFPGVIPFALLDPFKVIPSVMAGSAVSGILIALFGCKVNVVSGGLLALKISGAIVGLFGFIVSVIIGTLVTAYLYSYLKKYK